MKQKCIYLLWLFVYIICVGLGTLYEDILVLQIFQGLFAVLFFVPPVLLVLEGLKDGQKKYLMQIRVISIVSLVLTLAFMIANIAAVYASEAVGNTLNQIYILVAPPMHCLPYGFISIFLWACLLMLTFPRLWKEKK